MSTQPGKLAVVLSGGGSKGAFQVGLLDELILQRKVKVDIFAGVSTGAIQALGGAQDDIAKLRDVWLGIRKNSDVYTKRFGGIVGGVIAGADSLYDAKPIREKIRAFADEARLRASGKNLLVGAVSLTTAEFKVIDETTPNIADWVYASAAVPVSFQPLKLRSAAGVEKWVDGGVRNITPLDEVMALRPRAILVVLASPLLREQPEKADYSNLVEIGLRSAGILTSEVFENDVKNAALINDLLQARDAQRALLSQSGLDPATATRIMAPLEEQLFKYKFVPILLIAPKLQFSKSLEFDPAKIRLAMDAGRQAVGENWPAIERLIATSPAIA